MNQSKLKKVATVAIIATSFFAGIGAELRVSCLPKSGAKFLRGDAVYPEYLLNMSCAADWKRIGSTGGHLLKVSEVDATPGRRGLCFSVRIDRKNPRAPGWVAWQTMLTPELNLVGVDEVELEIYPLQKIPFPIVARFGTQKGFGQLPCTWADVVCNLEPGRWHKVRIPIKKSRDSVDSLRFDLNTRNDAIPHGREFSMILASIRFLPAPTPATTGFSCRMKTKTPLTNGFLFRSGSRELSDNAVLNYDMELAVRQPCEGVLSLSAGGKSWSAPVSLRAPFTALQIQLKDLAGSFPAGSLRLNTVLKTSDGTVLAENAMPMELLLFPSQAMEKKRKALLLQLAVLKKEMQELKALQIPCRLPEVTATVAELFLNFFIPDDFGRQKQYRIATGELADTERLLDELRRELQGYRQRNIRERAVTEFNPELPLTFQDGVIRQNGEPMLLIGPLVALPAISWSRYAPRLGFNSLVAETNMDHWLNFEKRKDEWLKRGSGLVPQPFRAYRGEAALVRDYLNRCKANHLAANLLLSSHYCREIPPEFAAACSGLAGHQNFNWNVLAPEAQAAFRRMYASIFPYLKNASHLVSLGTANEPGYQMKHNAPGAVEGFRRYLEKKYSAIAPLNTVWRSRYVSVDEILPEQCHTPAARIDWMAYQNQMVSHFYGYLKALLLAEFPQKQIWVKLMGNPGYEMLDEEENIRIGQNVASSDSAREYWLDHLRSLFPDRPITNHEWHFIEAAHTSDPAFLAMRMYQGVSRGIQSANIWRGQRADWTSRGYGHYESFSRWAIGLNAIGRGALKLRMLYPILLRFQALDGGKIRIYYDKNTHLLRGKKYWQETLKLYEHLRVNPSAVRFMYPDRISPKHLAGVRLLAAAELPYLSLTQIVVLDQWVKEGGTLWLSQAVQAQDLSGQAIPQSVPLSHFLAEPGKHSYGAGFVVVDPNDRGYQTMLDQISAWNRDQPDEAVECRVVTNVSGEPEYLSIVHLRNSSNNVQLRYAGRPFYFSGTDLWNDSSIDSADGTLKLAPYDVKLIRLDSKEK